MTNTNNIAATANAIPGCNAGNTSMRPNTINIAIIIPIRNALANLILVISQQCI